MTTMPTARKYLADAGATMRAGAALAPGLHGGMIVTLAGELGAGKTTLVRGLVRGLGWTAAVKSPSYTLVEHYPISRLYLYHFDFYRFNNAAEWEDAGFADYFRPDALCVIEWPERVRDRLPPIDIALSLHYRGEGRELSLQAGTPAGNACLAALALPVR